MRNPPRRVTRQAGVQQRLLKYWNRLHRIAMRNIHPRHLTSLKIHAELGSLWAAFLAEVCPIT